MTRGDATKPETQDSSADAPDPVSVRAVLAVARPEALLLSGALAALCVGASVGLAAPWIVARFVEGIIEKQQQLRFEGPVLWLIGLFFIGGLSTIARSYLFGIAGERIVARLRRQLYGALLAQEIGFFDKTRTGELTNRLASDATALQGTLTVTLSMGLRNTISGLGSLTILLFTSWRLSILMLALVPLIALSASFFGRRLRRLSKRVQDALADASSIAEETLSGVRTVRAFAREDGERARYGGAIEAAYELARRRAFLSALFHGSVSFAGYAAIAVVLWYGGVLLQRGELSFGTLTAFLLYTFNLAFALGVMSSLWEDLARARGASARIFELLERLPKGGGGSSQLADLRGELQLEGVGFRYPTRPEEAVLSELDLTLEPGRVLALVGPSGSGKSTVAALLSRFYEPSEGRLLLDGRDLRSLEPTWLRRQIGVVSQDPVLFATSIAENIRYGRPEATEAELRAAARAARAEDFILELREGYETRVGERGVRLSGGQRQRVAIARALLADPRILVLDEATSALDAASEALVQEALEGLMRGRTTLVIAHRLSTVRDADEIAVLDRGRVVERGRHEDLMRERGVYAALVATQAIAPPPGPADQPPL